MESNKNVKRKLEWRSVIAFVVDVIITSFCTVWLWNNIISVLFPIPEITILQGWLLGIVVMYCVPHRKTKIENAYEVLIYDILYTITIWIIAFVISLFAF